MLADPVFNLSEKSVPRISDVVRPWVERCPDRPALVEAAGTWTYQQLNTVVARTQSWLIALGIRPGDRVMIVCENCRAYVAVLLALASFDAWPVLVNARLSPREIDAIRAHCGARRLIYTTSVSPSANRGWAAE
jgi:acyl-CoA synthetase (AMP-forming)/AMP-acid ligase II